MTEPELKEFLEFNIHNLSEKLDKHAVLNQEVCELTATAYENVLNLELQITQKKSDLEAIKAATELNIREQLKAEKPKEGEVEARVLIDPEVMGVKEELRGFEVSLVKAKVEYTRLGDLRYNYQQMSKNMDNKTKLIVSSFIQY